MFTSIISLQQEQNTQFLTFFLIYVILSDFKTSNLVFLVATVPRSHALCLAGQQTEV